MLPYLLHGYYMGFKRTMGYKKIELSLQYLDWFMPSFDEAHELSGKTDPEDIAEFFLYKGVKNVVIKLGNQGCFVKPGNEKGYIVPAFSKVEVIDTSRCRRLILRRIYIRFYTMDWPVNECAKFANAVGAHCIMKIGTTAGIRSFKETLEFIRDYE